MGGQRQLLGELALDSFGWPQLMGQFASHLLVLAPAHFQRGDGTTFSTALPVSIEELPVRLHRHEPVADAGGKSVASGPNADTRIGGGESGME